MCSVVWSICGLQVLLCCVVWSVCCGQVVVCYVVWWGVCVEDRLYCVMCCVLECVC